MTERSLNCFINHTVRCRIVEGSDTLWAILMVREDLFTTENKFRVREVQLTNVDTEHSRYYASALLNFKCYRSVDSLILSNCMEECVLDAISGPFFDQSVAEILAWIELSPE